MIGSDGTCRLRYRIIGTVIGSSEARDVNEEQADRVKASRFGSAKRSDFDRDVMCMGVLYKVLRKAKQCSNAIRIAHIYDAPAAARLHVEEHFDRLSWRVSDDI